MDQPLEAIASTNNLHRLLAKEDEEMSDVVKISEFPPNYFIKSVFNEAIAGRQNGLAAVMMAMWVQLLLREHSDNEVQINQQVWITCLQLLRNQLMNLPKLRQLF